MIPEPDFGGLIPRKACTVPMASDVIRLGITAAEFLLGWLSGFETGLMECIHQGVLFGATYLGRAVSAYFPMKNIRLLILEISRTK